MVKDLLTGFIHEDWVNELNFDVMEPVKTSFISDSLRQREADVIWRIQWSGRWLYVYVLIEMQSSVDSMMALRLLSYVSLLYQDLAQRKELTPTGKLPPVFPITLYNGHRPWNAAQSMETLVEPVPESLQGYQLQFRYFLLDECQLTAAELPLSNLVSALVALENSESPDALNQALSSLITWLNQDTQEHRRLRRTFTVWLGRSLLPSRFPGVELPALDDLSEVRHMLSERVIEWTQQWKAEGMDEGIKKGIQQGIEQGIEQGRTEGLEKGALQTKQANARRMLAEGLAVDLIARVTGLSVTEVETLRP